MEASTAGCSQCFKAFIEGKILNKLAALLGSCLVSYSFGCVYHHRPIAHIFKSEQLVSFFLADG